jgi:hypothetical protein
LKPKTLYASGYTLDENGNVWSPYINGFLKPSINANGYSYCALYTPQGVRSITVHLEVWRLFGAIAVWGRLVHIDGNKQNNSIGNLRDSRPVLQYVEYIKQGISITKLSEYYQTPKKEISKYVAMAIPGGIRELRKRYPLNKLKDVTIC